MALLLGIRKWNAALHGYRNPERERERDLGE
jgi:hypothetical protein